MRAILFGAVLVAAANAASFAGGLDHLARQGLVPPTMPSYRTTEPTSEPVQQGLRPTVSPFGLGSIEDLLASGHGSAGVYSGTRTLLGPGLKRSQSVGGLSYPLDGNWSSTIEANVDNPSPLLGRGYALQGQLRRALPGGFGVSLGLRYNVRQFGGSAPDMAPEAWRLEEQGLPWRHALATTSASGGYELRLDYRYGERNSFGLTYGYGQESDATRQLLGLYPNEGRQFGLTGQHWLTPDWALSYGVMAQDPGLQRGQGLRLGLRYRF